MFLNQCAESLATMEINAGGENTGALFIWKTETRKLGPPSPPHPLTSPADPPHPPLAHNPVRSFLELRLYYCLPLAVPFAG